MWEYLPSNDELLQARLERGWQPTVSDVVGGKKILGYAACVVEE